MTIIEQVRSQKEAVAARHDFNVARIIEAARQRQEISGRRVIRQGKQDAPTSGGQCPSLNSSFPPRRG